MNKSVSMILLLQSEIASKLAFPHSAFIILYQIMNNITNNLNYIIYTEIKLHGNIHT